MNFTDAQIKQLKTYSGYFECYFHFHQDGPKASSYDLKLPSSFKKIPKRVKIVKLFINTLASKHIDIVFIVSLIDINSLVRLANFYDCPIIFNYLDLAYSEKIHEFPLYLQAMTELYSLDSARIEDFLKQMNLTLAYNITIDDISSNFKVKQFIKNYTKHLAWQTNSKKDHCRWCNVPLQFISEKLLFHSKLAQTPCCGLPLCRACIMPMILTLPRYICHFCGTKIYGGKADVEEESFHVLMTRRNLRS
jgi:hypothetical protein